MNTVKRCPICNSKDSYTLFSVEKFPYITVPVRTQDKARMLRKYNDTQLRGKLEPGVCRDCSHIYLKKRPQEKIISDLYIKYYSYPSALEGSFRPERDNSFLEVFNARIRKRLKKDQVKVLEIGCYDGYVLYNLKKSRFHVIGCDPSEGASIGRRFGIDIKKRFFDTQYFLKKGLVYDIIIFRHFLEHMPKPAEFIKGVKRILKHGGRIVFEVPNVEPYLKNQDVSIFSFQHVQYFSKTSILRLLQESGLRLADFIAAKDNFIVVCSEGMRRPHYSKAGVLKLCYSFKNGLKDKKLLLNGILKRFLDKGVILWGAGTFCSNVFKLYGLPLSSVSFIVDSDAKKWGMEFLDYPFKIKPPSELKKDSKSCLVVCSMYTGQIINRLKELPYNGPIIKLHPRITLYKGNKNGK